jgi:hypothetical protein
MSTVLGRGADSSSCNIRKSLHMIETFISFTLEMKQENEEYIEGVALSLVFV